VGKNEQIERKKELTPEAKNKESATKALKHTANELRPTRRARWARRIN